MTLTMAIGTPATAADVSTLDKSAQNVTSPGANPVNHGDVVNWVVKYDGKGTGPAAATITDPIVGAPGGQTYVPGSLHVPPGWTPSWSTDGNTYQGTDPGTATVAVRASNPAVRGTGTNLSGDLLPPVQAASQATGGDGFSPVLYRTPSGAVESWNMYHHLGYANAKVVCSDLATGQPCAGGPWPKPVNTTPGPLGSGSTGDIASPMVAQYVVDPGQPGIVYYSAATPTAVGVGCLDMAARANCGFFPLQTRAGSPGNVNNMAGLVESGGNLYGVAGTGQVLCLTIATRTPCSGQPYAAVAAPVSDLAYFYGAMTVAGGKVFTASTQPGSTPTMGCFDPATGTTCTNWTTPRALGPNGYYGYNTYTSFDTAGNANGVCATLTGNPDLISCLALDGSAMPPPPGLSTPPAGVIVFPPLTITAPNGHRQSYVPMWGGPYLGATTCYDWTQGAMCAGFPAPATHPGVNGGATRDYGYAYDTATQCLIALGDAGVLFSMDPTTGASPCVHSGTSVTLRPGDFYCDGGTSHVQGYQNARLENIDTANINLAASSVTVTDSATNATIATLPIAPDGTVDLSGISVAAHPGITVVAHLILLNSNDFTGGNRPSLVVSYQGDAPQVCFRTTVSTTCTVTGVSNTATGTDSTGALTSNTVSLPVAPGANCQPNVTVNKEICDSTNPHNCGPGKSGPWAKKSTPGLLGLLGTAYWRITVTNAGPVDATNVTLHDQAAASCESAAGTFTLPAGTSQQFYCSTYLLVLPHSNTAKASFVPANSPPGTPRTYTSPSTATACSLLCILN